MCIYHSESNTDAFGVGFLFGDCKLAMIGFSIGGLVSVVFCFGSFTVSYGAPLDSLRPFVICWCPGMELTAVAFMGLCVVGFSVVS